MTRYRVLTSFVRIIFRYIALLRLAPLILSTRSYNFSLPLLQTGSYDSTLLYTRESFTDSPSFAPTDLLILPSQPPKSNYNPMRRSTTHFRTP
jgi:hypothetical protein